MKGSVLAVVLAIHVLLAGFVCASGYAEPAQEQAPATRAAAGAQPLSGARKEDEEVRLGQRASAALEREYRLVRDPQQLARIERIGRDIAAVCDEPDYRYTFKILDTEDINALSLPGGFIYITKGMLSYVRSDDELAGVLAHEIAHAAHHYVRDLQRRESAANQYMILGVLGAVLLGRVQSEAVNNILLGAEFIKTAYLNQYGQEAETAADRSAVEYLIKAGTFNPVGVLTVIERLARDEMRQAGPSLGIYQTHPSGRQRASALERYLQAQNIPINRLAVQDTLRAQARAVTAGDKESAEVVLDGTVIYQTAAGLAAAEDVAARLNRALADNLEVRDILLSAEGDTILVRRAPLIHVTAADAALQRKPPAEVARSASLILARILWRIYLDQVY